MSGDSIQDLTNELNQLRQHPAQDFHFTPQDAQTYIGEIQKLLDALYSARGDISSLSNIGEVGTFASAQATKQNLLADVQHMTDLLDRHIAHLEAFKGAVDAASHSLQAADTP
jgi:hypothetical protein